MKYLSVCSGIEAASVAWHTLGWQPVAFSEIEKFPSQVLAHHYPDVPNLGDMTKFQEWPDESIDLLVGGTPCQSFSVAGLRRGMADPRGNLALTYLAIADRYKPRWIVWENVPGVLSSAGGRDFGSFLGALAKLGYGFAYRVLDARFFGVAQRRRRVFVVGYLGDWRRAAAVLFESPSGRRDTAPSREKRQSVAPTVVSGPPFSRTGNARVEADALVARMVAFGEYVDDGTASAMKARDYKDATDLVAHAFKVRQACEGGGKGYLGSDELAFTLATHQDQHIAQPVSYDFFNITAPVNRQNRKSGDPCHTLARSDAEHAVVLQPVAFTRCDYGGDAVVDGTPTMRCGSNYSAHLAVAQPVAVDIDNCNLTGDCTGNILAGAQMRTNKGMGVMQPVAFHVNAQADQMNFSSETTASLTCSQRAGVAFRETADCLTAAYGTKWNGNASADNGSLFASQAMQVRRLTPTECERLQGFPDGYTNIKENCPDGPRYKALGNSMAVPVMRWIGERIQIVNELSDINKSKRAA